MKEIEEKVKHAFREEEELPEIVEKGIRDAYVMIRLREGGKQDGGSSAEESRNGMRTMGILKVAAFFAVCFAVLGTSAFAVQTILSRYERMKSMEPSEKTEIYEDVQKSGALLFKSSRQFSERELGRYDELEEKYHENEAFPIRNLRKLALGEEYNGIGVCLSVTESGQENVLYLPERELTDEELLEIIEYNEKIDYVMREQRQKREFGEEVWEERLSKMTDEEVDRYYLACYGAAKSEFYGGFCRDGQSSRTGVKVLSKTEEERYEEMKAAYRESNRVPVGEIIVIERPEEYDGKSVAYCRWDCVYYVPLGELTEEDFLQVIDFETKANYSIQRILEEINYGKRSGLPVEEKADEELTPIALESKAFANVEGTEKAISDAGIGDVVRFGSYEQDGDSGNGKEPISWYVLDKTKDAMMLLAVNVLDGQKYHEKQEPVTWDQCSLRKWLNDDFLNEAFSEQEKACLIRMEVKNDFGENTADAVTLLSVRECMEYFGIDPEEPGADPRKFYEGIYEVGISKKEKESRMKRFLNASDSRRFGKAARVLWWDGVHMGQLGTIIQGKVESILEETNVDISFMIGYCNWWLRDLDPDFPDGAARTANMFSYWGTTYVYSIQGVRPVIWIKK